MMKKIISILLTALLFIGFCQITTFAYQNTNANDDLHSYDISPEEDTVSPIYPILDANVYDEQDNIEINFQIRIQDDIVNISYESTGFDVISAPDVVGENIQIVLAYNCQIECPTFLLNVTFENEGQITKSIYAYNANDKIYLSTNSLFMAKDVYWAEVLSQGIKTQEDYGYFAMRKVRTNQRHPLGGSRILRSKLAVELARQAA